MSSTRSRWLTAIALVLILFVAFALRTYNVDWADGQLPHPDERSTVAFYAPTIKWPSDSSTLLDPRKSTLNPLWDVGAGRRRSFTYGHFPLYLMVAAGHLTPKLVPVAEAIGAPEEYIHMMRIANGSPGFGWVGRIIMALADTITVFYLFLIGRRLYSKEAGLVAAALGAFTVIQIQLAHFFAVDPISTTFTVAAVYHAIRMVDTRGWTQTILTGVMAALAIASKFSAAPILAAPAVAGLIISWRQQHEEEEGASKGEVPGLLLGAAALVVAGVVFVITSPFVILDFENFNQAVIKEQGAMVRGEADFPFTRQYRGTIPYLYFIDELVRWGMGWPLGILGWLAFGWVIVKVLLRRVMAGELIVLSWLVPYFLITGSFLAKFNRYMVPVAPFLSLLAAGMLWTFAGWWVRRKQSTVNSQQSTVSETDARDKEPEVGIPPAELASPDTAKASEVKEKIQALTVNNQQPTINESVDSVVEGGDELGSEVREQSSEVGEGEPMRSPGDQEQEISDGQSVEEQPGDSSESPIPNTQHPISTPTHHAPRSAQRKTFAILSTIVLIPTILWALAFVNGVYGTEHTFITASKWMYENVPDGSVWITEHWEEGMPLHLNLPEGGGSPGAHGWQNLTMPMYEEDNAGKFETLKQNLREGDYYVLATKRLYGALPHLPERYPLSTRFYELLFDGQLGYELAGEFTTYPSLFGVEINDQSADESFWVYDHPRTLIYEKVRDLSDAEWDELLGGTWETAIPGYTGQRLQDQGRQAAFESEEKEGPSLLLDKPVNTLPDVGTIAWNPLRESSFASLLFWWLALVVITVITWPIAFGIFGNLRDRGYGFSKALGLIMVGWLAWMLTRLPFLINNMLPLALAFLFLLLLSVWMWKRKGAEMRIFLRAHRKLIMLSEAIFAGAFLLFVFIRVLNPDLWQPWQGGEKLMEFAFFNAVTRTPTFPPYDPYFAGGTMNYYYYGYQLLAVLVKLTGIKTSIAFNLAIPTLFALTGAGVFSLVYSLAPRPRRSGGPTWWRWGVGAGLIGVFIVSIMGNLEGGLIIFRQIAERSASDFASNIPLLQNAVHTAAGLRDVLGGTMELPAYNFWTPSRVIPATINEFPFWSFLFADLHPHMIGIPFTVLFLALAYNLVAGYGQSWKSEGWLEGLLSMLALPLTLGAIGAINTWDLPTYFGIGVLAWVIRQWKGFGRVRLVPTLLFVLGLGSLSYLLYRPFYSNYTTVFNTGVGLTYMKTDLGMWLRIWGFFVFAIISYVALQMRRYPGDVSSLRWISGLLGHSHQASRYLDLVRALVQPGWQMSFGLVVVGVSILLGVVAAFLGYWVIALLLPLLTCTALFLIRRSTTAEAQFRALLFFTGILVLIGVEIFYLKDFLCGCGDGFFDSNHGDWYRMNTLFKFYTQVWVILGIAIAAALPALIEWVSQWRKVWRYAWFGLLGLLVVLGLVFPILGTADRVEDRFPGPRPTRNTLDGMAFMSVGQYSWPSHENTIELQYDYDAIRWLQENITGTPMLAEAPASWYDVNGQNSGYDYYRAGGLRVSSMTGLPTFLGQHQGEQRFGQQVGPREQVGREFWQTTDIARLRQIIDDLHVDYVYVGQLERTLFTPAQLSKFDVLVDLDEAEIVYENDGVTIYHLISDS